MEVAYRKQLDEYLEKIDSVIETAGTRIIGKAFLHILFLNGTRTLNSVCFFTGVFTVFRHITTSGIPDLCITREILFIGIIKRNTARISITVILCQCLRQKTSMQKNGLAF